MEADNAPIWVAIIGAAVAITVSVGLPLMTKFLEAKTRANEKEADYHRQDELAQRAIDAAQAAALRAEKATMELATATATTNEKLLAAAKTADDQLKVLHTMGNSTLTAAKQEAFDATTLTLAMALQTVAITEKGGQVPTKELLAAIETARGKIIALRTELDQRIAADTLVKLQQENQKAENAAAGIPPAI